MFLHDAPSCVPATEEDENGARLTHHELVPLSSGKRVLGLGEVMDATQCGGAMKSHEQD